MSQKIKKTNNKFRIATKFIFFVSWTLFLGGVIGLLFFTNSQSSYFKASGFSNFHLLNSKGNPYLQYSACGYSDPDSDLSLLQPIWQGFYMFQVFMVFLLGGTYFKKPNSFATSINRLGDKNSWIWILILSTIILIVLLIIFISLFIKKTYGAKVFVSIFSAFILVAMIAGFSGMLYYFSLGSVWTKGKCARCSDLQSTPLGQTWYLWIVPGCILLFAIVGYILLVVDTHLFNQNSRKENFNKTYSDDVKVEDKDLNARIIRVKQGLKESLKKSK